jgi:integrase/recombinase XerD
MNQLFITKHLGHFENVLKIRTPSKATQTNYRSQFLRFANEFNGNPKTATTAQLTEYISTITSRSQMAQMRSALKVFYEEVLKQPNKIPFIPYPKQEQRMPQAHPFDKIINGISLTENTKHRLMLTMLLGTGVRVGELISLQWSDITRTKSKTNPILLHVKGKGAKDRLVPISDNTVNLLKKYCKEYKMNCETNSQDFIFGDEKPYSARSVAEVVRMAGEKVGLKLSPHDLRHACFFYLRDSGTDLATIQELAGHSNPKTSKIYAPLRAEGVMMPI